MRSAGSIVGRACSDVSPLLGAGRNLLLRLTLSEGLRGVATPSPDNGTDLKLGWMFCRVGGEDLEGEGIALVFGKPDKPARLFFGVREGLCGIMVEDVLEELEAQALGDVNCVAKGNFSWGPPVQLLVCQLVEDVNTVLHAWEPELWW